jgi:hypothetical protein
MRLAGGSLASFTAPTSYSYEDLPYPPPGMLKHSVPPTDVHFKNDLNLFFLMMMSLYFWRVLATPLLMSLIFYF